MRRESDGATCRRVSLQAMTASARRLHYWVTPDYGAIGLSRVGLPDKFRAPILVALGNDERAG